ncbi:MAG: hypothetical protein AAGI11_17595 [Pseudomonadota bacterium]
MTRTTDLLNEALSKEGRGAFELDHSTRRRVRVQVDPPITAEGLTACQVAEVEKGTWGLAPLERWRQECELLEDRPIYINVMDAWKVAPLFYACERLAESEASPPSPEIITKTACGGRIEVKNFTLLTESQRRYRDERGGSMREAYLGSNLEQWYPEAGRGWTIYDKDFYPHFNAAIQGLAERPTETDAKVVLEAMRRTSAERLGLNWVRTDMNRLY